MINAANAGRDSRLVWRDLSAAIAAALLTMSFAPAVFAQSGQEAASEAGLLEEVIVTATRREQTLQEVPMAITAFTGAELAALQADNLDSIQGAVPNLNLVQGRGSNSSVNAFIRGVGQPDALQTFDPAVGIYVDDVYMSRIQGAMFKLYDVERVEVLRGPQGTLYGKNTPGGAIRLITHMPGQEFEARAGVTFGNYSRFQAAGYLSGPLSENFAMSLSVLHDERDGFVTDPATGREYNDEDTTAARLKAKWDINDDVNIVFAADYSDEDVALTLGRAEATIVSTDLGTGLGVIRQLPPTGEYDFQTRTSFTGDEGQKVENTGLSMTINWDINDQMSFKSITASRELDADLYIDIDATEWELGDVFVGIDQEQFTQEFQLLGNNGDNINWVAGVYYLNEEIPSHQEAYADDWLLFFGTPITALRTIDDDLETTSYAAFGQVDWAFADRWTLGLGIRYTDEKKDYFRTTSLFTNLLGNFDPQFAFNDSDSWSSWTPTVSLDYAMSDSTHLYSRLARGFKSGGFNGRANTPADQSAFDPETVLTLEFGAKTSMADGRLQANYAVFWSQYDDYQARVSLGEGLDATFPVLNAAELDIAGAEVEMVWVPIDPLQLTAQVGYLDSEYGAGGFSGADGIPDEPAFSPKWTMRYAGMYTFDLSGGGTLNFGADAHYRDEMQLSVENTPALMEDSYWVFNGWVNWTSADQHWSLTGGMKNATDEVYKVEGQDFRSVANVQTSYFGDPKTWTVTLEYRY